MTFRAAMLMCTCGAPTGESSFLCNGCKDKLWTALGDVAAVVAELEVTLARQRRFETQTSGSRSAVTELPFDLAASNALHELRNELVVLVRLCIDADVPSADYQQREPGDTCSSFAGWLMWRLDGIAAQPWAADALRLCRLVERSHSVIDRPPDRTFAGPCDQCGRDLYAVKGESSVTCHACSLVYDLSARREWLLAVVDDQLATSTEIARALTSLDMPVTAERIRQWKHRERIDVKAHDRLGHPMFRVGDVVSLLVEQSERHAEKRGA